MSIHALFADEVQWNEGSYAAEYVVNGMMRFVRGQYSSAVLHGGMLGYVLDGNTAQAIKNVTGAVQDRHVDLGMSPPGNMQISVLHPSDTRLRETHHTRQHSTDLFRIHHIFVSGVISVAS